MNATNSLVASYTYNNKLLLLAILCLYIANTHTTLIKIAMFQNYTQAFSFYAINLSKTLIGIIIAFSYHAISQPVT